MSTNAKTEKRMKPWVIGKGKTMDVPALIKREPTIRSIGAGYGFNLRVLNNGQHWEFKRDGRLIEWWPSTGRFLVDKKGDRREHIVHIDELRSLLGKEAA